MIQSKTINREEYIDKNYKRKNRLGDIDDDGLKLNTKEIKISFKQQEVNQIVHSLKSIGTLNRKIYNVIEELKKCLKTFL